MLSLVQMLRTIEPSQRSTKITPQDTGLYVFPNCTTGALMCVEYSMSVAGEVELLLMGAHLSREQKFLPIDVVPARIAAKMMGISQSTLWRWVAKGWVRAWSTQTPFNPIYWTDNGVDEPTPPTYVGRSNYFFSAQEAEAYRLAKPRAL